MGSEAPNQSKRLPVVQGGPGPRMPHRGSDRAGGRKERPGLTAGAQKRKGTQPKQSALFYRRFAGSGMARMNTTAAK